MKKYDRYNTRLSCFNFLTRHNANNGATIVEFALILPLFFVLIFGIIEFGIMMYDRAILINASREGARAGAVYGYSFSEDDGSYVFSYMNKENIENIVNNYCANNLISFKSGVILDIDIDPPDSENASSGDLLTVRVSYDFSFLVFSNIIKLIGGSFEDGIPLKAESKMRFE